MQQQQREDRPLLMATERERAPAGQHFERPEQAKLHRFHAGRRLQGQNLQRRRLRVKGAVGQFGHGAVCCLHYRCCVHNAFKRSGFLGLVGSGLLAAGASPGAALARGRRSTVALALKAKNIGRRYAGDRPLFATVSPGVAGTRHGRCQLHAQSRRDREARGGAHGPARRRASPGRCRSGSRQARTR